MNDKETRTLELSVDTLLEENEKFRKQLDYYKTEYENFCHIKDDSLANAGECKSESTISYPYNDNDFYIDSRRLPNNYDCANCPYFRERNKSNFPFEPNDWPPYYPWYVPNPWVYQPSTTCKTYSTNTLGDDK